MFLFDKNNRSLGEIDMTDNFMSKIREKIPKAHRLDLRYVKDKDGRTVGYLKTKL